MEFNKYQSSVEELNLSDYPEEVQEQFWDYIDNVPFIKSLISPNRPYAKDLPRDDEDKIIVDITKPHILENMDYFRQSAIQFHKTGRFTDLRPNANPNSEYGKWIREEIRRCYEGMVRPSDGEWITGDMYFFLNYWPIMQTKYKKGSKKGERIIDFPEVWDGIYLRYHYLQQAINGGIFDERGGNNGCEISSRGKSKSYTMSSILGKRFILGESTEVNKAVKCMATAYQKQYLTSDGILNKFQAGIDFLAQNTQWPSKRLKSSLQDMVWTMGYKDLDTGTNKGTLNEVIGVSAKDDPSKVRGKRQNFIVVEEFGSFRNVLELYNIMIPSVQEGDISFGTMYLIGCVCAGTKVWRNNGTLCNIEDLKPEEGILGYTDSLEISQEHISKWQPKVYKPCVRITFDDRVLECSIDHPILIQQVSHTRRKDNPKLRNTSYHPIFRRAANLKTGDSVCVADGIDVFGNSTLFDARLVGMLIGDGTYGYNNTPEYCSEDSILLNYVKNKYEWSLGNEYLTTKGNLYQEIRIKNICSNLRDIGIYGQTKNNKRLPDCYLSLNKEQASLLIAGLWDTDGCFHYSKSYCGFFTSSCIDLIKQIKVLMEKFGIFTSITKKAPNIKEGRKDKNSWYELRIVDDISFKRFEEHIPILVPHKKEALHNIVNRVKGNSRCTARYYNGDYRVIKVRNVEFIGPQQVWNLQADYTHTYIANGIITHNTSGDDESDFQGAQEIVYNPEGYRMYGIPNVFDKEGQGRPKITFFFPGFLGRKGCYDDNGNSDITKALLEILADRYRVKYNSTDIKSITKTIAEIPITPQEAILRSKGNMFPVTQLNEQIVSLDANPNSYDDVYVGNLVLDKKGEVLFKPTTDKPIREFPLKDNTAKGALEIYSMPEKDSNGKVYPSRYIAGFDPYDNDQADSMSLGSFFVLDLFTDRIAAEYTGRTNYADELYEIGRLLCIFYNCKCLYEAHPYDQYVYTPNGKKLWKDIQIGDTLFSINGEQTKVINIPIDGEDDIYQIELIDGRTVQCSKNHIWNVYEPFKNRYCTRNVTTEYILQTGVKNKHNQLNFYIPNQGKVEYSHKPVPIDAYTMGLLIAEGAFTKFKKNKYENFKRRMVQFSSSKDDAEFYKKVIPYPIKYIGTKGFSWHLYIDDVDIILDNLGLLHKNSSEKFIPDIYLFNDTQTRLELLKGLMDGDGCACTNGASVFITTSKKLSEDIKLLCRGLGIKAYNNKGRKATDKNKESYRIAISSTTPIFKLPRKVLAQYIYNPSSTGSKANGFLTRTGIKSITYIGKKKCKCVTVDREDGLYLIGDYVVTHNCNKKGAYSYFSRMNSTHLLADTPQYLRDKQLVKYNSFGSNQKGVNASAPINNYANSLIRDWLLKEVPVTIEEDGKDKVITTYNLSFIKSRALLKELVLYNPDINVDRIRALGMLMLYREEKMILYQGDMSRTKESNNRTYLGKDPYFEKNFKSSKFRKNQY